MTNLSHIMDGPGKLKNERLFELFSMSSNDIIKRPGTEWERLHRFTDPWGHDYIFLLEPVTNSAGKMKHQLKVRSVGSNGVDENGKGDDITGRGIELE